MSEPYRRGSTAVHEASYLLKKQGWFVIRWYGSRSPPDLFAMRKGAFLVLMVRSSRRPVPDARAVSILYGEELERMRTVGIPASIPMECWVHAPPDGWKCYEVLPGGIRRIRWKGINPAHECTEEPGRNQVTFNNDISFHGQEMKGYKYSTSAGIFPGESRRNEAVKEECLTSIASATISQAPVAPAPDTEPRRPPRVTGHA